MPEIGYRLTTVQQIETQNRPGGKAEKSLFGDNKLTTDCPNTDRRCSVLTISDVRVDNIFSVSFLRTVSCQNLNAINDDSEFLPELSSSSQELYFDPVEH